MPRIEIDLTRAICPGFEDPEWEFLRESMVNAHQGDPSLTLDGVAQQLKDAWACENQCKVDAWNIQVQQDQVERDRLDMEASEARAAQEAQHEKDAEEARKEVEKKKLKLCLIVQDRYVSKWIGARLATYALNKLNSLEYVELDYFTTKGCREVATDSNKSVSQDTLTFTQVGDSFAIRPMAALRPSKQIRNDEDLSWEEMMDAKNIMLHYMAKSRAWEDEHATALTSFYINLDCHQRKEQDNSKMALLLYQSRVCREWFDSLKRDEGFNIDLIEEDLLCTLAEEVNNAVRNRENAARDREFDQVRLPDPLDLRTQLTKSNFPPSPIQTLRFAHCTLAINYPQHIIFTPARCHLPFAICHLPFAILPFAILPFAICHLPYPLASCRAPAMIPLRANALAMNPPRAFAPAMTPPCQNAQ